MSTFSPILYKYFCYNFSSKNSISRKVLEIFEWVLSCCIPWYVPCTTILITPFRPLGTFSCTASHLDTSLHVCCLCSGRISNKPQRHITVNAESMAATYHVSENSVKVYVDVNNGSQRSTKDYNKVSCFSFACFTIDNLLTKFMLKSI